MKTMKRTLPGALLAGAYLLTSGCGGSSASGPSGAAGSGLGEFLATLPDGSPMLVDVDINDGKLWEGQFHVLTATGPYAFQSGSFGGILHGNSISADFVCFDNTEFQATGKSNGAAGFQLTRSDIPGTLINFKPYVATPPAARGTVRFNVKIGDSTGQVNISDTSVISGGYPVFKGTCTIDGEERSAFIGLYGHSSQQITEFSTVVGRNLVAGIINGAVVASKFGQSAQTCSSTQETAWFGNKWVSLHGGATISTTP